MDGTGYLWEDKAYDEGGNESEEEAVFIPLGGETKSAEEVSVEVKTNKCKGDGGGTDDWGGGGERSKGGGEAGGDKEQVWWSDGR